MYSKTHWQDRVVDPETGEVVQEGTFVSAEHFNNMEDGIEANDTAIAAINEDIETIEETIDTGVGTTIALTVNSSTFVMKLALKNSEGNILSESEVDLPIESMIVNAEYLESTKSLVLTLQSGSKVTVPLSALINGLVNDTRKVAGMDLKKDITVAEMVTALGVDEKADKTEISLIKNSIKGTAEGQFVTDENATMTKTVPEKCVKGVISKISGKTVKDGSTLKSAVVESVVSQGKNLFDEKCESGYYDYTTGNPQANANEIRSLNYIELKPNTQYYVVGYAIIICYDADKKRVNAFEKRNATFTTPSNCVYVRMSFGSSYGKVYKNDTAIVEGATGTYSPYNKTTVLVPNSVKNLPDYGLGIVKSDGTIVANEVDFENGVYYRRVKSVKVGSLNSWEHVGTNGYYSNDLSGVTIADSVCVCSKYNYSATTWTANGCGITSGKSFWIGDNSFANASALKTELADVDLVYMLQSPEVISITDIIFPFQCEAGGTVTLVNEHNLDMPNAIIYEKEVL